MKKTGNTVCLVLFITKKGPFVGYLVYVFDSRVRSRKKWLLFVIITSRFHHIYFTDFDECATNSDNCHDDATCMNSPGGYECKCNDGYRGNGVFCKGKHF